MIIAVGEMDLNPVLEGLILMAKDLTGTHELNQKQGQGSWTHHDGWGISYLKDGKWVTIKSPKAIFEDPSCDFIRNLKTPVAILHVRRKTLGEPSIENSHPFQEECENLGEFVFCHNGSVRDEIKFSPKYTPKGETDTEKLFYSILTDIPGKENYKFINKKISSYNDSSGSNIILSNKEKSIIGVNYKKFESYYKMCLAKINQKGIVISSESLPTIQNTSWKELENGDVVVVDNKTLNITIENVESNEKEIITQP